MLLLINKLHYDIAKTAQHLVINQNPIMPRVILQWNNAHSKTSPTGCDGVQCMSNIPNIFIDIVRSEIYMKV